MSKYLVRTTEVFRVDSEAEAKNFIEQQKKKYTVHKYSSEYKEKKIKGQVADAWYRVTLVKDYNDEKEPAEAYIEENENE